MSITLPDIELADPDDTNGEPVTLGVEVRLSELGNHYLRVEADLSGATPPQVYAAMLRAAPEFGDLVQLGTPLRPTSPTGAPADGAAGAGTGGQWRRLSDFATEVVRDVSAQLAAHSGMGVRRSGRPGLYHVLVSVDRGSLVSPADGTVLPVATAVEAATAIGAQPLCHPVRNGISSLAEWLRYPVEVDELPIVDAPGFAGDLLLRTCNTTLLVQPGTPDYMVGEVEEPAEFVATLEGMFAGWQDQLADYYDQIQVQLATMISRLEKGESEPDPTSLESGAYERDTQELVDMQARLEAQQLRLHRFVMTNRLILMFVTSPSLVISPVARLTIDRLLTAAKFDALRGEFESMIDKVLGDRIDLLVAASIRRQQERNHALARAVREQQAALARMEREREEREARLRAAGERAAAERQARRERANRRRSDVLIGAMTAVGVSGVMQILQAGFDLRGRVTVLLVLLVALLSILAGWQLHRSHPDSAYAVRQQQPEPAAQDVPPHPAPRDAGTQSGPAERLVEGSSR
jgi:hypothetical protein